MKWATLLHPLHHLRTCHKLGIWDTPFPHTCDWVIVQHLIISPSLLNPVAVNPSRPCIPDGLAPKLQPDGKTPGHFTVRCIKPHWKIVKRSFSWCRTVVTVGKWFVNSMHTMYYYIW
jgi:hypothetical protein